MYRLSLYFDRETERRLQRYMEQVAAKTGNSYMLDQQILPHLTIASFREGREEELVRAMEALAGTWRRGRIDWVSPGCFKPHVLFLAPVLNRYLHELCLSANQAGEQFCERGRQNHCRPFAWFPHTTIGRQLTEDQMLAGFHILQANFQPFSGTAVKAGLAKSRPYRDIRVWQLSEAGNHQQDL